MSDASSEVSAQQREGLSSRLQLIREQIWSAAKSAGRQPEQVRLLAVSKLVEPTLVRAAYELGVRDFAENYAQEAVEKIEKLADLREAKWHFIGHLQSNKVKLVAGHFAFLHAIDRLKIVKTIGETLTTLGRESQSILIEVNLAGEKSKSGCEIADLPKLLAQTQTVPGVHLEGLMFMAPLNLPADEQRRYYSRARELRDTMLKHVSSPHHLRELSMGTSYDFASAIAEGATSVRIGTALFGERLQEGGR